MRVRCVLCLGNPPETTLAERVAPSACKNHLYSPKHITMTSSSYALQLSCDVYVLITTYIQTFELFFNHYSWIIRLLCSAANYETWCSEVFCLCGRIYDVMCECAPEKGIKDMIVETIILSADPDNLS